MCVSIFAFWGLLKRSKAFSHFLSLCWIESHNKLPLHLLWERASPSGSTLSHRPINHVSWVCREAFLYRRCWQRWNVRTFRPISCFDRKSWSLSFSCSCSSHSCLPLLPVNDNCFLLDDDLSVIPFAAMLMGFYSETPSYIELKFSVVLLLCVGWLIGIGSDLVLIKLKFGWKLVFCFW